MITQVTYGDGEIVLIDTDMAHLVEGYPLRTHEDVIEIFLTFYEYGSKWIPLMNWIYEASTADAVDHRRAKPKNGNPHDCRFENITFTKLPCKIRDGGRYSLQDKEEMYRLRQSGIPAREVAQRFGCLPQYIHDVVGLMRKREEQAS